MTKTINTTLATANNNYFDLKEYTEGMPEAYVAAQIAQSTAWRIDTLIVAEARTIFKAVREDLYAHGVDGYAELTAALHEAEFAEQSFREIGSSIEGSIEKLRALNAQRDQWHEVAQDLTSMTSDWKGQPRVYTLEPLENAFYKDMSTKVNATTQRRLRMSANKMAEVYGAADAAEELYKRKLERQSTQLGRIAETMKDQAGAVFQMFQMALRDDDIGAALRPKNFYALPIEVQRVLLDNAIRAAERADEFAANERNMSDSEYDRILVTVIKAVKDFRAVLNSHRFVTSARVAEAALM